MTCNCNAKTPITVNAQIGGAAVTKPYDGREIISIPVVALVDGVVNGARVEPAEFAEFLNAWEGIPVPVNHPVMNGVNVSANLPSVIASSVIGRFHDVKLVDNKLIGELYIFPDDAKRKGFEGVLNALLAGQVMDVSTAYFCDEITENGNFNGVVFNRRQSNFRPDHLALLPTSSGACSVKDGCGTFMANAWAKVRKLFIGNEQSYDQVEHAVSEAIKAELTQADPYPYMIDIFSDRVVYELGGTMYQRDYTIAGDMVTLGSSVPVRAEKTYTPVSEPIINEADDMSEMTPEQLTAVNWAQKQYSDRQNALVSEIVANAANKFTAEQLKALHVDQLETLALTLRPVDFSARGGVAPITNSNDVPDALPASGYAF